MNNIFKHVTFHLFVLLLLFGCKKKTNVEDQIPNKPIPSEKPITGIRIAWDYSTMKKISPDGANYNGYARVVQLTDGSLFCVFERNGSVVHVKSTDGGANWSLPQVIAEQNNGTNMAVPDVLELKDGSLLVCYNPRPYQLDGVRKFAIRTKKSYDGGRTWKDERLLYEAGAEFENGCWEPSALQLPSGEIQLYFANEGVYRNSNEQNISMLRSLDNGLSWTKEPEIVSFRAGSRDGMPVPLLLKDKVLVAIEDNGFDNFKPYIIRNSVLENWQQIVNANSVNRTYALSEKLGDAVYAGAPYLRQLSSGETLLAYQGTEGRISNSLGNAEMKVAIGNNNGESFNRKTVPFLLPSDRSGLWNSIQVLKGDTVIALTSTNGYSSSSTEVWMIKGYVIPEIEANQAKISVDGNPEEAEWKNSFPVFIGHRSLTQARSKVSYDSDYLYILSLVKDANVTTNANTVDNNDGLTVLIDPEGKSYVKPAKGVFSVFLSADNKLVVKEGENGNWVLIKDKPDIIHSSKGIEKGYLQEIGIPWSFLGGKPKSNTRMDFNLSLTENTGRNTPNYIESISSNDNAAPFTWTGLRLK